MSSIAQHLLTIEEFQLLPRSEHKELVRGEVVETMPPDKKHGPIAVSIATLLRLWTKQGAGGKVGVESGFILTRAPDTVRAPDVFYISASRLPSDDKSQAFWTIAPDLAVAIVSKNETAVEVQEKVSDFLAAHTDGMDRLPTYTHSDRP